MKQLTKLTTRQQQVLEHITAFIHTEGRPPTLRELCQAFGWKSNNAARQHLRLLAQKGALKLDPYCSRGIRLPPAIVAAQIRQVPLLGRVAAGRPMEALEHVEQQLTIDANLFPEADLFALTVRGDSMNGIGICDGDTALVRKDSAPRPGMIVVAILDNEATVKRYCIQRRKHILRAENPDYDDIPLTPDRACEWVGEVVGIMRRLQPLSGRPRKRKVSVQGPVERAKRAKRDRH